MVSLIHLLSHINSTLAWRAYYQNSLERRNRQAVGFLWLAQQKLKRAFIAWADWYTTRKLRKVLSLPLAQRVNTKIIEKYPFLFVVFNWGDKLQIFSNMEIPVLRISAT